MNTLSFVSILYLASLSHGMLTSQTLDIITPPTFTKSFTCTSELNTNINWYWEPANNNRRHSDHVLIYNRTLAKSRHKYIVRNIIQNDTVISTLTIFNIAMRDAGIYVCINNQTDEYKKIYLSIISTDDILNICKSTCINNDVYIKCAFRYSSIRKMRIKLIINGVDVSKMFTNENEQSNIVHHTSYLMYPKLCFYPIEIIAKINDNEYEPLTYTITDLLKYTKIPVKLSNTDYILSNVCRRN